jgi:hypothetical protein
LHASLQEDLIESLVLGLSFYGLGTRHYKGRDTRLAPADYGRSKPQVFDATISA